LKQKIIHRWNLLQQKIVHKVRLLKQKIVDKVRLLQQKIVHIFKLLPQLLEKLKLIKKIAINLYFLSDMDIYIKKNTRSVAIHIVSILMLSLFLMCCLTFLESMQIWWKNAGIFSVNSYYKFEGICLHYFRMDDAVDFRKINKSNIGKSFTKHLALDYCELNFYKRIASTNKNQHKIYLIRITRPYSGYFKLKEKKLHSFLTVYVFYLPKERFHDWFYNQTVIDRGLRKYLREFEVEVRKKAVGVSEENILKLVKRERCKKQLYIIKAWKAKKLQIPETMLKKIYETSKERFS